MLWNTMETFTYVFTQNAWNNTLHDNNFVFEEIAVTKNTQDSLPDSAK